MDKYLIKEKRILTALEKKKTRFAVLGRGESFSWLTSGGNSQVSIASEYGPAILIISNERRILVAHTMDGRRILEEELAGLGFELVEVFWFDGAPRTKALELIGGESYVCDISLGTQAPDQGFFENLYYPLTNDEQTRYRELAKTAEQILYEVALQVKPGMREIDIANNLLARYGEHGISAPVMIIGSDERIAKYRHCLPTDKRIEKVLLISPAVRRHGLCVPISRMVYLGDKMEASLASSYTALLGIEAATLSACVPGTSFLTISEEQRKGFKEFGYAKEWDLHFQGGLTGYIINDPTRCRDPETFVEDGQAFNWYITISGAKVEETVIVGEKGLDIISQNNIWPLRKVAFGDKHVQLPDVLKI